MRADPKIRKGHWQDRANVLRALDAAELSLGIKKVRFSLYQANLNRVQPEDWYSVTLADLRQVGFPSRLTRLELAGALEQKYPDYKWEKVYLLKGRLGRQKYLERTVAALFPVSVFEVLHTVIIIRYA